MSTVSVPVSELTGSALDWAVAKCEGESLQKGLGRTWQYWTTKVGFGELGIYAPSTNWSQGGPIIEQNFIGLQRWNDDNEWAADIGGDFDQYGETPLIVAMRCYVASKLGNTVDIPTELVAQ